MNRFVTLRRVAEEAQVSVYSASRALNGLPGVSETTRARILDVAARLGYVPNRAAQLLRGGATRTIGILTSNAVNVYYAKLVAGVEDVVRPFGYHTLTSDAMDDGTYSTKREAEFVDTMLEMRSAAVILTYRVETANLERLLERKIPVVFVDCTPPDAYADLPFAMSDGAGISREVGEHFASHGYGEWTYLGHTAGWPTRMGREAGITAAAHQAGANLSVVEGSNSISTAYQAMERFLSTRAGRTTDAIYTSNEHLLIGAIKALNEVGRRVGRDVGIISFDDFDWAPAFEVPISVVDQKIRETGSYAGALVLNACGKNENGNSPPMPEPVLTIRESCGPHS